MAAAAADLKLTTTVAGLAGVADCAGL